MELTQFEMELLEISILQSIEEIQDRMKNISKVMVDKETVLANLKKNTEAAVAAREALLRKIKKQVRIS